MAGKMGRGLPQRAATPQPQQESRTRTTAGKARRVARQAQNQVRAAANTAAGLTPKRRTRIRPRSENMKLCVRCRARQIVAGSVCWCADIGVVAWRGDLRVWVIQRVGG